MGHRNFLINQYVTKACTPIHSAQVTCDDFYKISTNSGWQAKLKAALLTTNSMKMNFNYSLDFQLVQLSQQWIHTRPC